MTKKEILKQTQLLVNEYLGCDDLIINGHNWSKGRLIKRLKAYQKMVDLKRKADELLSKYSHEDLKYMAVIGQMDETVIEAYRLKQEANEIWLTNF